MALCDNLAWGSWRAQDARACGGSGRFRVAGLVSLLAPAVFLSGYAARVPPLRVDRMAGAVSSSGLPAIGSFVAISCPSESTCYSVGATGTAPAVLARTTDDGAKWNVVAVRGVDWLQAIACVSAKRCVVTGGNTSGKTPGVVLLTTNGGSTLVQAHPARRDGPGLHDQLPGGLQLRSPGQQRYEASGCHRHE